MLVLDRPPGTFRLFENRMRRYASVARLRKFAMAAFAVTWLSLAAVRPSPVRGVGYDELAAHWAPVFYQDVNSTYGYRADYLTNFNYDGDWAGNNNWENLNSYNLYSYVYYSIVETQTHYFIGYYTYHPRDDGPTALDKHENDLEGVMLVIRKDGSKYGSFQLMETVAHNQFYQYTNDSNISTGSDNVDGGVLFSNGRPCVFIQANGQSPWGGHGVYAWDGSGAPGGDGIVYVYGGTADVVTDATGDYTHTYRYALLSIDDLWSRRTDIGDGHTFGSWGALDGDTYQADAAKLPWAWDDPDDGPTFTGDFIADPAHLIDTHLNGLGTFSHEYVYHPYYTHRLSVSSVTSLADRDPFGNGSDIYVKMIANGVAHSDDRLWKKNDASVNTSYSVAWGTMDAGFAGQYSSSYNTRYVAVPPNSTVTIEINDSDGTSGDDQMGSLTASPSVGQTVNWTNALTSNGQARVTATVEAVR